MNHKEEGDVLLLDGDCGLCHRLAKFVDKRKSQNSIIVFRAIESDEGQEIIATFPKKQQDADTVYIVRKGKSYIRSAAGIRVLLYMKWHWRIWFPIVWITPFPLRDIVYRLIARFRHRIFKPPSSCIFPEN